MPCNKLYRKKSRKGYMCVYNWITLLHTWDSHNTVNQPYFNSKKDSCTRGERLNSTPQKQRREGLRAVEKCWVRPVGRPPRWRLSCSCSLFLEARLLTFHRAWETGSLSFLLMTSQVGWLPFLGCKTGQRTGEDLHLKGAEEEFETTTFLKEMLFKIRGGGA